MELFRSQHIMLGTLKKDFDTATYLISEISVMCNKMLIPLIKYYPKRNIILNDTFDIIIAGGEVFASDDTLHEYAVSIIYAIKEHNYKVLITIDDIHVHIETPLFHSCICEKLYQYDDINIMIKAIDVIFDNLPRALTPSFVMHILESHKKNIK